MTLVQAIIAEKLTQMCHRGRPELHDWVLYTPCFSLIREESFGLESNVVQYPRGFPHKISTETEIVYAAMKTRTALLTQLTLESEPARSLENGHIHLWIWQVDANALLAEEMMGLSAEEQQRAQRFLRVEHRARWTRAHLGMRRILASYTGCTAEELKILKGPHGKPHLDPEQQLQFNLSHSGGWCALGIAREIELGVDIEEHRPVQREVWRKVLTAEEWQELGTVLEAEQESAFFRCWTRKEAIGKADGRGLVSLLAHAHVGVRPIPASREVLIDTAGQPRRWHLQDLHPAPLVYGAVASSARAEVTVWLAG
jgi:4'-phosphopantetheinyl transferase